MHGPVRTYYGCGKVSPASSWDSRARNGFITGGPHRNCPERRCWPHAGMAFFWGQWQGPTNRPPTFGAVSVVIAAAIGGIMVPVFAMPPVMQTISIFSPLSWGLNAFLDVFVRGGSLAVCST